MPSSLTDEPAAAAAATAGNAAEEGSPGTVKLGGKLGLAADGHAPAAGRERLAPDRGPHRLEHALGMIARRRGLDHRGLPGACRPASRTADFTWAEATGLS